MAEIKTFKLKATPSTTFFFRPHLLFYIQGGLTNHFAQWVLPNITQPFALITSNYPYSAPRGTADLAMLDHPLLLKWFAKNPGIYHPKFQTIPLGFTMRSKSFDNQFDKHIR